MSALRNLAIPFGLAVAISLFHLYTGVFGVLEARLQRGIHIYSLLLLALMVCPLPKKWRKLDYLFMLGCIASLIFTVWENPRISGRVMHVDPLLSRDLVFAVFTIILLLEATRRAVGLPLTLLAIVFLLHGWLGHLLPGRWGHYPMPLSDLLDGLYMQSIGIFGIPLGVSANYAFLFILFGAFLVKCGTGDFFLNLGMSIAGRSRGGPAKVSIFSSALFGTISGNAVANVYGTGSFTIPLMMRLGYSPVFAGAVEAAASTGGMIMPPVMGTAAFVMAELMGKRYIDVAVAAAIPAILYYLSLAIVVHLRAVKIGLSGVPAEQLPRFGRVLREGAHQLSPLIVLTAALFTYSPTRAVILGLGAIILSSFVKASTRLSFRGAMEALADGGRNGIMIAVACATAGIIVGSLEMTGTSFKFVSLLLSFTGKSFLVPVLVMIACIILGMGLPVTAVYIVVASMVIPGLLEVGITKMAAHMFILYFSTLGAITPPVAFAAYAAASISKAPAMSVGVAASRIALAGFIVPFMFIYGPQLVLEGTFFEIFGAFVSSTIGIVALACSIEGYMLTRATFFERLVLLASALLLIKVGLLTDVIGAAGIVLVFGLQKSRIRRQVAAKISPSEIAY